MPAASNAFWTCVKSSWSLVVGDPTMLGWLATGLLGFAAFLSFRCGRWEAFSGSAHKHKRWFWLSTAVLLAILAVNKQLDLQTYVLAAGRCVSRFQGWYEARRSVQLIAALAATGMIAMWITWILLGLRGSLSSMRLELLGILTLGLFIAMRLFGLFHVIDTWDHLMIAKWLEITGPALLILAVRQAWKVQHHPASLHR